MRHMLSARAWMGLVLVATVEGLLAVELGYFEWSLPVQWAVSALMAAIPGFMFQPDARELFREVVLRKPPRQLT